MPILNQTKDSVLAGIQRSQQLEIPEEIDTKRTSTLSDRFNALLSSIESVGSEDGGFRWPSEFLQDTEEQCERSNQKG